MLESIPNPKHTRDKRSLTNYRKYYIGAEKEPQISNKEGKVIQKIPEHINEKTKQIAHFANYK